MSDKAFDMIEIAFVACYLMFPILGYRIFRLSGLKLTEVSVPAVFFAVYVLLSYAGLLPLFFFWDPYRVEMGITNRSLIFLTLLTTGSVLLLVCLGMVLVASFLPVRRRTLPEISLGIGRNGYAWVLFCWALCMTVFMFYLRTLPGIPLLAALAGMGKEAGLLRSMATNAYAGRQHYYSLFFSHLLPFIVYVAVAIAIGRRRLGSWLVCGVIFLTTMFVMIAATEKSPVVYLFSGIALTFLIARKIDIRLRHVLILGVAAVILMSLVQCYIGSALGRPIGDILYMIASRLGASSGVAYYYLGMFPDAHSFLLGSSFPNPRGILPFEGYALTREVMHFIAGGVTSSGVVGSCPAVFWAELYANYSGIGVVVLSPVVGMALYVIHWLLNRCPRHVATDALTTWCCIHYSYLCISSISDYLLDTQLVIVLLAYSVCIVIDSGRNPLVLVCRAGTFTLRKAILIRRPAGTGEPVSRGSS